MPKKSKKEKKMMMFVLDSGLILYSRTGLNLNGVLTLGLIVICAASCFLLAFSDTVKLGDGKLYHGFATPRGLWLVRSLGGRECRLRPLSPSAARYLYLHYRLRPVDFVHAFLGVSVFLASAFSTPLVASCLLGADDSGAGSADSTLVGSVPLLIGFLAALLCVLFPSKRRGFDRPPLLEHLGV
jgi:hypothetical protein